jgi:hypothetical protein
LRKWFGTISWRNEQSTDLTDHRPAGEEIMKAEPKWFKWLVLAGICLGIALIVANFLKAAFP